MSFDNQGAPSAAPTSSPAPVSAPASSPAPSQPSPNNPFLRRADPAPRTSDHSQQPTSAPAEGRPSDSAAGEARPLTPDSAQPQQGQQQMQAQPQVQQPQQVVMTPEMLAQMMRGIQPQQPTQQPAEEQMSPEQFRQKYNIYEFSAQDYEAVFGVAPDNPQRVAAFNQILQNIARQSVTMSRALAQMEINNWSQQFDQRLTPLQQQHQAQVEESYKQTFFQQNPGLKDREPLLKEIIAAAKSRGVTFSTPQEAMNYVAQTAQKLLGINPQAPAANVPAGGQSRPMPTLSSGGRAGNSAPAKPMNTAQSIFGRPGR